MQGFARPSVNGIGGPYTDAQVKAALTAPAGRERWVFDLLDSQRRYLADLTSYIDKSMQPPTITHDTTMDVHESATIQMRGDSPWEDLSQLFRGHYQLAMPDGGLADFVIGTWTPLPGNSSITPAQTWTQVTATDLTQLLQDATFANAFSARAGTGYIDNIAAIVAGLDGPVPIEMSIPDIGLVLPADLPWDSGTTLLKAINDLLGAINYFPAWCDEMGTLRSGPIPDYNLVVPSYVFDATQRGSIVWSGTLEREPDFSNVYNDFVLRCEDPRRIAFSSHYEVTDPSNPVSLKRSHRKTLNWQDSTITDRAVADQAARTKAQKSCRIYEPLLADTYSWPVSQDNDVYKFIYSTPDEGLTDWLYLETARMMTCAPGQNTNHTWSRILPT